MHTERTQFLNGLRRMRDKIAAAGDPAMDRRLHKIDEALERAQVGLYPTCEQCGERIAMEVLIENLDRTVCPACEARFRQAKA